MTIKNSIIHKNVELAGVKTSIRIRTGMAPALICIHGSGLGQDTFTELFSEELLQENTLISYDLPGHGLSGMPDEPDRIFSYQGYSAHLRELIEYLKLDSFILIGHSLGAHIALQYSALRDSPKSEGLFLVSAVPISDLGSAAMSHKTPPPPPYSEDEATPERITDYLASLFTDDSTFRKRLKPILLQTRTEAKTVFFKNLNQFGMQNELQLLKSIPCKVSFVLGENDRIIDTGYIKTTTGPELGSTDISFNIINNSGHIPMWENRKEFNKLLKSFLL